MTITSLKSWNATWQNISSKNWLSVMQIYHTGRLVCKLISHFLFSSFLSILSVFHRIMSNSWNCVKVKKIDSVKLLIPWTTIRFLEEAITQQQIHWTRFQSWYVGVCWLHPYQIFSSLLNFRTSNIKGAFWDQKTIFNKHIYGRWKGIP